MEPVKIIFLGTGNAVPTKQRNHTSILLNYKNENILIDCGEGTQRQFRCANLSPNKLTRICITHWHGDHTLGLPGLLQTLKMQDYQKKLIIVGPKGTKEKCELFEKIYEKLYDFAKIKTEISDISSEKFFENKEFFIESAEMMHNIPTLAYKFVIKDKLKLDPKKLKKFKLPNSPILKKLSEGKNITFEGKKIKASDVSYIEKGKKITFILDTEFNQNAINFAKNSDILVCEASFTKEEKKLAHEYKHLTAEEAAKIAKKAKAKKLILTHLSQRYEHNPKIILDEAKKVFKNVSLAEDLSSIIV